MEDIKIENVTVVPLENSAFLKPVRMVFTQNGQKRYWDLAKVHDSVTCLLYNSSRKVLIFVKQFRPSVFFFRALPPSCSSTNSIDELTRTSIDWTTLSPKLGITLELCTGVVDDATSTLAELMRREVLEECGYQVPLENFSKITSYRGVGICAEKETMFYAEVSDQMRVSQGGGLAEEGEFIEVVEMSVAEARKLVENEEVTRTSGLLFGVMWFLANKNEKQ
ncbi:unnamed protein product [Orchesella dallaii]|uniref:Nudix hydrolase domain-containing protein n=1 Tax=Orchesella dallaii TaxID=48710 RepID=A0ABP1RQH6_9HEXA